MLDKTSQPNIGLPIRSCEITPRQRIKKVSLQHPYKIALFLKKFFAYIINIINNIKAYILLYKEQ